MRMSQRAAGLRPIARARRVRCQRMAPRSRAQQRFRAIRDLGRWPEIPRESGVQQPMGFPWHRSPRSLLAFFPDGHRGLYPPGTCVSAVSNLAGSRLWGEAPSVGPPVGEQASAPRRPTRVVFWGARAVDYRLLGLWVCGSVGFCAPPNRLVACAP